MQCFGRAHLRRDVKRLRSQHSGDRTSAAARASRAAPAAAGPSPASPGGHRAVPVPRTVPARAATWRLRVWDARPPRRLCEVRVFYR